MNAKRAFYGMLGGIVILTVLAVGATYYAQKLINEEGDKLLELKTEQAVLTKQRAALTQAKKDISEFSELETVAKSIVPQEKDQARTVLEIIQIARESGIEIRSVTFPESLLGQAAGRSAKKGGPTVDANTTQLTPLDAPKGVYVMEIRIQSSSEQPVTYEQLVVFLQNLERNRRTAQVKDINIQPDANDRSRVTFSLTLNSYVKP